MTSSEDEDDDNNPTGADAIARTTDANLCALPLMTDVCLSLGRPGESDETEARTSLPVSEALKTERRPGSEGGDELGGVKEKAKPRGTKREAS